MDSEGGNTKVNGKEAQPQLDGINRLNHHFFWYHLRVVLLFTMLTLAAVVIYQAYSSPFQFFPQSIDAFSRSSASNSSSPEKKDMGFEPILKRAAMPDRTVIITYLNEAWIEPDSIFDLFLTSFRIGNQTAWLLKHLLVVSLDQRAFDHCSGMNLNCYFLQTEGVNLSSEAHFMSPDYLKIVWRKIDFLTNVLELGYNFLFTDADIMWLRNPFPHFYSDTDFQISCDMFLGNPSNINTPQNSGLIFVKSNNQTIEFYKFWYKSRELYPLEHDQDVFKRLKYSPFIREIGLKITFLSTAYFGGFCQPSKDLNVVCTMHANCCAGLDNKIHDLKILLEDWRNYQSLPANVRQTHKSSWSVPQSCGPHSFHQHIPRKKKGNTRKEGRVIREHLLKW